MKNTTMRLGIAYHRVGAKLAHVLINVIDRVLAYIVRRRGNERFL